MKKIFLIFGIIALISTVIVSAECNGCLNNNQCYNIGETLNNKYCSMSKSFLSQKRDNVSCQNNFECLSNYCMDEICINEQILTNLGIDYNLLNQTENYLKQGNCTATPGCLNKTSLLNAQNISGICTNGPTFKCFQCNSDNPYWNGSACTETPCHYDAPGCWNITKLNELDHYENVSESCNSGFICTKCVRNYVWDGVTCVYYTGGGGTNPPIIWKTNATFTEDSLTNGFTIKLKAKERISISFKGVSYFIGVVSLTSTSALINVSSKSQQIIMNIGNERKFDLNNDGTNDITITLSTISSNQATFSIKKLSQPSTPVVTCTEGETKVKYCPRGGTINTEICENGVFIKTNNKCTTPVEPSSPISNNLIWIIIIIFIVIAIIITFILIIYFLKQKKPKSIFTKPDFPRPSFQMPSFPRPTNFPPNRRRPPFPRRSY